jgi:two-component system phosphate regulon sensor histidine kinase PhoR
MCLGAGPDQPVGKLAAMIARSANAPIAMIHLTDDGTMLHVAGVFGMPAEWSRIGPTPVGQTVSRLVLESQHPIVIPDITEDPRVPPHAPAIRLGVRAYAGFPIRDPGERIVGICMAVDFVPRQWLPEQLAAVDEAAQACTALVAEQQRAETHRRFLEAILQHLHTGVAACDEHGRLVFTNDAILRMAGPMPLGEHIRECAERHHLTDDRGRPLAPAESPLCRAMRGEEVRDVELTVGGPGNPTGTLIADAQLITSADGRPLGAVTAVRDVTDQRRAAELTVALARSKDDYLALIGHELRTPLTSITAYIEMLREADPATIADDLPVALEVLSRNSTALRKIIDQLMDLAALDGGHAGLAREPICVAGVLRDAAEAAHPIAAAAGVDVTLDIATETMIIGDPARIRQLADQLLGNAIKHTPGGGQVVAALAEPDPDAVELTVTDTGLGIPDDERDRLFAPFHRTQLSRRHGIEGNGLGLAISRAVVEGHRGTIRLIPSTGPGSRIVVRLPVSSTRTG